MGRLPLQHAHGVAWTRHFTGLGRTRAVPQGGRRGGAVHNARELLLQLQIVQNEAVAVVGCAEAVLAAGGSGKVGADPGGQLGANPVVAAGQLPPWQPLLQQLLPRARAPSSRLWRPKLRGACPGVRLELGRVTGFRPQKKGSKARLLAGLPEVLLPERSVKCWGCVASFMLLADRTSCTAAPRCPAKAEERVSSTQPRASHRGDGSSGCKKGGLPLPPRA